MVLSYNGFAFYTNLAPNTFTMHSGLNNINCERPPRTLQSDSNL